MTVDPNSDESSVIDPDKNTTTVLRDCNNENTPATVTKDCNSKDRPVTMGVLQFKI